MTHQDLIRITEEELNKPSIRQELEEFFDDIYPETDFLDEDLTGMDDLKIENEI